MSVHHPKYFTLKELTVTSTGLENNPTTWEQVYNLRELALFLDEVRASFGKPIRVNCAFRSPAVNSRVGGVSTSAHLSGMAADICAWSGKEADNRELLAVLEKRIDSLDQLVSYHTVAKDVNTKIRFIHVGFSAKSRHQRICK